MAQHCTDRWFPVAEPVIGEEEVAYVTDAVRSGWVSSIGPYLKRFEHDFARFAGTRHAIAVCNGTVALHLGLHALGIGPGDEVIIPDLTFAATAHAVLQVNATPVFVDVSAESWCMDPRAVERALSPKTRAIIPVHLYGHPADMSAISAIAKSRGLRVIEDAAEAHGACIGGRTVGSFGELGAFSFYGNKVLTTGEGGMLTTNDDTLADRIRLLKDHGMHPSRRYFHTELAFNYRMTNLQAALGVAQLQRVDSLLQRKRDIHGWYVEAMRSFPHVSLNPELPGYSSVFWMVCLVLGQESAISRDRLAVEIGKRGVDTRPFFVPLSQMPHLAGFRTVGSEGEGCPVARSLAERGLNLPSGSGMTEDDVNAVAEIVGQALS